MQGGDELSALLEALKNKQAQLAAAHGKYVPLAVKIAPDLDEAQIDDIAHVVKSVEMDGIMPPTQPSTNQAWTAIRSQANKAA